MKARQRYAGAVRTLVALALSGSAVAAQQQAPLQRGQVPGPRFLVPILRASEPGLGRTAGEQIRERMGDEFMLRQLWIIPKSDIDNTLQASGYSQTEALNGNDLKALAQLLRAEEYVDAQISKGGPGFEVEGTVQMVRGEGMVQPLPKVSGAKLGDVAKALSSEIEKSRKQNTSAASCLLNWRQNKFDDAAADAAKAMKEYPNSVYARVCILETYNTRKLGPDSIVRVSEDILKLHPGNKRALALVADAYAALKREDKYISALTQLLAADPTNQRLQQTVVDALGAAGKPEIAKPIIDEAVRQNPGDPTLIRLQWNIYRAMKDYKGAVVVGEEMIKSDTAAADTLFFQRLVAAYLSAGDTAKAADASGRAVAKFPGSVSLLLAQGQLARQTGQAPVALRAFESALKLDPKTTGANLQIAQIFSEQGQVDSLMKYLRSALDAGDDKKMAGGMMLSAANKAFQAFQKSDPKEVAAGKNVLGLLQFADSLNASETAKFLMGATELVLAQTLLTAAGQERSCDKAKEGNDLLVQAQIHVPQGGKAFPDQARQLMAGLTQLNAYGEQVSKAICK